LATGRTPYELLISLRMERARDLLRDPRLQVTDVAFAVGYKTPSSFAAAFHKLVGVTPSAFRRGL
jgi:AraC family transcriptional regulator